MSKTFTELGALTSLAGVDVLAVVDMTDSTTKKITATNIAAFLADLEQTLASKTLTSPVLNGTLSGTAFLDEDDMASDSAIAAASQQSIKAHVASGAVTFSNKNFSQSGTVTITDTGNTGLEEPLKLNAPNLSSSGDMRLYLGVEDVSKNEGTITFYYAGDGSTSNFLSFGIYGVDNYLLRLDGSGNVGIGASSDGDKLYVSGTGEYTDTLTLSKASGTGLSVTSDIDFNAIASGATKAELNAAADGIGVTIPRQKIVSIGDWNMNSTASVAVAHGLTGSKIKSVTGSFRNDTGNGLFPITSRQVQDSGVSDYQVYISNWDATNINVYRGSSTYEAINAEYDGTGFSRGELIVSYID
jgi:hypothetical protein